MRPNQDSLILFYFFKMYLFLQRDRRQTLAGVCYNGKWLRTALGVWIENLSFKNNVLGGVVARYSWRSMREMLLHYWEKYCFCFWFWRNSHKVLLMRLQLVIWRSLTQHVFPLSLLKPTLPFAQSLLFNQARRINLTKQNVFRNQCDHSSIAFSGTSQMLPSC